MNRILISIKPEYAQRILDGTKKYEFRRIIAKEKVKSLILYSTSPIKEIVGEVEVIEIIEMPPSPLWEKAKSAAGISREKFRKYFLGQKKAYAYVLGHVTKFEAGKKLSDIGIDAPPQSFIYLNQEQYDMLGKEGDA